MLPERMEKGLRPLFSLFSNVLFPYGRLIKDMFLPFLFHLPGLQKEQSRTGSRVDSANAFALS